MRWRGSVPLRGSSRMMISGIVHQGRGEAHPLSHTARVSAQGSVLSVLQPDHSDGPIDRLGDAGKSVHFRGQLD